MADDMPNNRRVVTAAITREVIAVSGNPSLQPKEKKPSFRGGAKRRTRNLEIPGLVLRTIPDVLLHIGE